MLFLTVYLFAALVSTSVNCQTPFVKADVSALPSARSSRRIIAGVNLASCAGRKLPVNFEGTSSATAASKCRSFASLLQGPVHR